MRQSSKTDGSKKDHNDDLSDPTAILLKLQELKAIVYKSIAGEVPVDFPWYKDQALFLSWIHLKHELMVQHPAFRDERYEAQGTALETVELHSLQEFLEHAKLAYLTCYLELQDRLARHSFRLIRHDTATEPGRVGHYVAVNHNRKVLVIAIKGTSTFSDALTDALGKAMEHTLDASPFEGLSPGGESSNVRDATTTIRCHEGMFTAAMMLLTDTQHLVEQLFLPLHYKIVVCGHSLGAGVACLLGLLLRSRIAVLRKQDSTTLRVLAYATPTCLGYQAALKCAPFITTVVNNNDCVPRLSVPNAVTIFQIFARLDRALRDKGRSLDSFRSARAWMTDMTKVDCDTVMTRDELQDFMQDILQARPLDELEHALVCPGRVVVLWERNTSMDEPKHPLAEGETWTDARVLHGGLAVLRLIEIELNMITDHSCDKYQANLKRLLDQRQESLVSI
jgi:Lipase (class 3)